MSDNIHPEALAQLIAACEAAIAQARKQYRALYDEAAWHNNNVPGVGQTVPYASYPALPEWVGAMEIALRDLTRTDSE